MTAYPTLLDQVVAKRRAADRLEAEILADVADYCDQHPVDDAVAAASWSEPGLLGDHAIPLAGDGTPDVSEDAVIDLAAALEIPYRSGLSLVADSLELRHRLPRLWALVHTGVLQAWRARHAAQETTHLSRDAVDWVDRHLTVAARRGRLTRAAAQSAVREARLRFDDPDLDQDDLTRRGVWFDHTDVATTTLTATLDALALDESISSLATTLGRLGDPTDLDTRRATALGVLADPQTALDLQDGQAHDRETDRAVTLYVHVTKDDLDENTVGTVERLGPATVDLLADWLTRSPQVIVRPVLDLAGTRAVDRHDPPEAMREQVTLRDPTCVFPGCTTDARRCDLDHIVPYDDTGPPGQTNPHNLAPLCRRHHRAKTRRRWTYHRADDGTYTWARGA